MLLHARLIGPLFWTRHGNYEPGFRCRLRRWFAAAAWDRRPPSAIEARIGAAFSMTGAALQPKSLSATASIATTPSSSATPPPEAEQPFRPTREIFFGRPATFFAGYPVRPRGRTWAPLR